MFLRLIEATNRLPPVNDLVLINIQFITTTVMRVDITTHDDIVRRMRS